MTSRRFRRRGGCDEGHPWRIRAGSRRRLSHSRHRTESLRLISKQGSPPPEPESSAEEPTRSTRSPPGGAVSAIPWVYWEANKSHRRGPRALGGNLKTGQEGAAEDRPKAQDAQPRRLCGGGKGSDLTRKRAGRSDVSGLLWQGAARIWTPLARGCASKDGCWAELRLQSHLRPLWGARALRAMRESRAR